MELKIGPWDYTSALQRCRIVGSAASKYHTVILELLTPGEYITEKEEFCSHDIELTIDQVDQDGSIVGDSVIFNLMCIRVDGLDLKQKSAIDTKNQNDPSDTNYLDNVVLGCIPINAFTAMTTTVSKCFMEDFQKPPIEAVKHIVNIFLPNMRSNIDMGNINTNNLPRTFNVPQMPFSTFLDWIDGREFGDLSVNSYGPLYSGPYVAFCLHDEFYMKSLNYQINQPPEYKIHLLANGSDVSTIMKKTYEDPKIMYTDIPIQTKNLTSGKYGGTGFNKTIRVKPSDDLYHEITINSEDVFKENAVKYGTTSVKDIHPAIKNVSSYNSQSVGNEYNDMWAKVQLARKLSFTSEIIITLTGKLPISRLLKVGVPMDFNPMPLSYMGYEGRYISMAHDIVISRMKTEISSCICRIRCLRGNVKNK
jgi:hypothetical protein